MKKRYVSLSLFFLFSLLHAPSSAQTGIEAPELRDVDRTILSFMKKWDIPGGSVAITKHGRLVYARGFGFANQETNEWVQPDHQFRIASLSKPITSIAILKLISEGKLTMDSPVFGSNGILNDAAYQNTADERVKNITIRHLLQHTAGWDREKSNDPMFDPVHIAQVEHAPAPANQAAVIRFVLSRALDFSPGSRYAYSNIGYCLLGRVIEKITGISYEHYIASSILRPLEISSIQLGKNLLSNKLDREVQYYESDGDRLVPSCYGNGELVPWAYGGFNLEAMDSHGGWVASAPDLLRLITAVDGFDTRPDIVDSATISLMTSTPDEISSSYAMGWQVNQSGNWWHTGSLPGSSTLLVRTHEGFTWAVLFNRRPTDRAYFGELDRLIWNGIRYITEWPIYDLFEQPIATLSTALLPVEDENEESGGGIIYPNPNAGIFEVALPEHTQPPSEVTIRNGLGQVVESKSVHNGDTESTATYSIEGQPNGIYFMHITTPTGTTMHRFIKQ